MGNGQVNKNFAQPPKKEGQINQISSSKLPNSSQQENIQSRTSVQEFALAQRISREGIQAILKKLDEKQYKIIKKLGQGTFGIVFKAINKENKEVAIKLINAKEEQSFESCKQEVHNLLQVDSRHVIKLLDSFIDNDNRIYYIITEYCPKNSLSQFLVDYPHPEKEKIKKIFKGIIQGIIDLHEKRVIHSDLKPANILLDKDGEAKICDFGLSILKENDGISLRDQKGLTDNYCAPEQHMDQVGYLSDIYSAGLILRDLCFPEKKGQELTHKLDDSEEFSDFVELIKAMTIQFPDHRIRLEDIMKKLENPKHVCVKPEPTIKIDKVVALLDKGQKKTIFSETINEIDQLIDESIQFQSEFFKKWEDVFKKDNNQRLQQ